LLDILPPEFRQYSVLQRYPAALAVMARHYTAAMVEGARAGYRTARTELAEQVPPHAVDELLKAYRAEGFRLATNARGVVLVEQALRGKEQRPKLIPPGWLTWARAGAMSSRTGGAATGARGARSGRSRTQTGRSSDLDRLGCPVHGVSDAD
jgi:hypothetical protein